MGIHTWPQAQMLGLSSDLSSFFKQCGASELDHLLLSSFFPSQGSQWTLCQMITWGFSSILSVMNDIDSLQILNQGYTPERSPAGVMYYPSTSAQRGVVG